jgi:beta-barrel assembly-enhancing protease
MRRAPPTESWKLGFLMSFFIRSLAGFAAILFLLPEAAWPGTSSQVRSWEMQVGQQRYLEYMQRGEIVPPQSPLYRTLDVVGNAIAAVADRQYYVPFHFIVLNEQAPNGFSMPGGNVYVTTGLLSLLKNRDELAGVLCHEVSHDIHHDVYAVFQATQRARSPQDPSVISYERSAEANADRSGAYICAKAGFNPWGMVWNFRQYRQTMGVSNNGGADHPSDARREADLVALFQSDKAVFGKFHDNVASATPLALPQIAQRQYSPYAQYSSYSQRSQYYPQYSQQNAQNYYQQYPQQYSPQQYSPQQYSPQQYSPQQGPQYSPQQYPQYPPQQYPPQQYPPQQYPPYPPPSLPPCYPGC